MSITEINKMLEDSIKSTTEIMKALVHLEDKSVNNNLIKGMKDIRSQLIDGGRDKDNVIIHSINEILKK